MATINTIAIAAKNVKSVDVGVYNINGKPVLPAAPNADRIVLFTAPHGIRVSSVHLKVPATLGANATLKVQKNSGGVYTDASATTTAATAGVVTGATTGPFDLAAGDSIELLVGGGALTSGQVEYDILCQHA